MSNVYFISDLHLGHKNICKFAGPMRGDVKTVEEHDEWIIDRWNSVVTKRDLIWVLGDVAFSKGDLDKVKLLNGCKHLILGNHDEFSLNLYSQYFNKIHGFLKYKGMWLSHCPINPIQLRRKVNIHGHVHHNSLINPCYINVSVEALNGFPKPLDEILAHAQGLRDMKLID